MSPLLYVGITQDRVPVGIRERIHADADRCRRIVRAASSFADGAMILSTCERFEVYSTMAAADAAPWVELLAREFGFSTDVLSAHVRVCFGEQVARHMLRVAAGLESRLLGEPQIHRQLRGAYLAGLAQRELGPVLSALGRSAIHAGKRVRRETQLAAAGGSIIDLALARLPSGVKLKPRVVVLGTGALAREALVRLTATGRRNLAIVSRNPRRAQLLAERFAGEAFALADMRSALRSADALLACSSAPEGFLVTRDDISRRRTRSLRIIDLGMPRNVDPDLAARPAVDLVHLEKLHAFSQAPASAIDAATAILDDELARFRDWLAARHAAREITALCSAADQNLASRRKLHARITRIKAQVAA
ncbi:MAG: hypothetical protein H6817_11895 [Phycisphaerales bacterium]|nr:hypothetical protein [Phycisphaerales bacterium]